MIDKRVFILLLTAFVLGIVSSIDRSDIDEAAPEESIAISKDTGPERQLPRLPAMASRDDHDTEAMERRDCPHDNEPRR
jgi:hypothetical protein